MAKAVASKLSFIGSRYEQNSLIGLHGPITLSEILAMRKDIMHKMMIGVPREKVKLITKGGESALEVDALISNSIALIEDTTVVISDNDYIVRTLPNGLVENYIVVDNGYFNGGGHGIPPHYQVKLKKVSTLPAT